jgi:hypothetical protein
MPETILHHYQLSPYSEKIRLALGLKGLSWRSVEIPVWTPRPKLVVSSTFTTASTCWTSGFAPFGIRPTIAAPRCQCTNHVRQEIRRERSAFRRHASQTYRKITNYSTSDNPLGGDQQGGRDCETKRFGGPIVDNKVYFSIINRHKPLGQLRTRLANISRTPTISLAGTGLLYK